MKRNGILAFCMIFLFTALLAGCAGPVSVNRTQAVSLLQAAREDLKLIDGLIADKDLGLLDEGGSASEELTQDSIASYQAIIGGYSRDINDRLEDIKARPALTNADFAAFQQAELDEFEQAAGLLDEFAQVLRYAGSLLELGGDLAGMGSMDMTDPEKAYAAISDALAKATDKLKNSDTPSFLKSMNDNMIESLSEMDQAVKYTLAAAQMNDPLRSSAAAYRMGILERKFAKITSDAGKDAQDRMVKLKGDTQRIKTANAGLKAWVLDGLQKLGAD